MDLKNFPDRPKIFVRFPPGASGHFMGLCILNLQCPVELTTYHHGHDQGHLIEYGHNFHQQFTKVFEANTNIDADIGQSSDWLKQNFFFQDISRDFYIIKTHAVNYEPFLLAWPESKIVSIIIDETDVDQVAFNYVKKSLEIFPDATWGPIKNKLKYIQDQLGKLKWTDIKKLKENLDWQLLAYINKFGNTFDGRPLLYQRYINYDQIAKENHRVFKIDFSSITDLSLINKIDSMVEFLGFQVEKDRLSTTIDMIENYAKAQIAVPFKISLEMYD